MVLIRSGYLSDMQNKLVRARFAKPLIFTYTERASQGSLQPQGATLPVIRELVGYLTGYSVSPTASRVRINPFGIDTLVCGEDGERVGDIAIDGSLVEDIDLVEGTISRLGQYVRTRFANKD